MRFPVILAVSAGAASVSAYRPGELNARAVYDAGYKAGLQARAVQERSYNHFVARSGSSSKTPFKIHEDSTATRGRSRSPSPDRSGRLRTPSPSVTRESQNAANQQAGSGRHPHGDGPGQENVAPRMRRRSGNSSKKPIKIHEDSTATRGRSRSPSPDRSGRLRTPSPSVSRESQNAANQQAGSGRQPHGDGGGRENVAPRMLRRSGNGSKKPFKIHEDSSATRGRSRSPSPDRSGRLRTPSPSVSRESQNAANQQAGTGRQPDGDGPGKENRAPRMFRRSKDKKPIKIHEDSSATRGRSRSPSPDRSGRLRTPSPSVTRESQNAANQQAGTGRQPDGDGPGKENRAPRMFRRSKDKKPIKIHEDSSATRGRSRSPSPDRSGRLRTPSPSVTRESQNAENQRAQHGRYPDGDGPGKENRAPRMK
ncbi:hypothetical protein K461DRAFT_85642 [Myriangium duriaei CBS 260.36]|uniref:DUF3824 domain-containing protein n=1 Tax=Myriangium duriaei CBS 260.36 TaxID=1168546 RepID=A0A9P4J6G6_9PEZI|nr:hypothetical protein K461DRAFT_85642 [Myriangium duriaei CBS 260.36]